MSIVDHPDADRAAKRLMDGYDRIRAEAANARPAEWYVENHGEDDLRAELADADREPLEADDPADRRALKAMDGADRVEATSRQQSPSGYLEAEYGIDASAFTSAEALRNAVTAVATEDT